MKDEMFFDTNILAYAFDETERTKAQICAKLIKDVTKSDILGCLSNQVLAEFYTSLTERLRKPLPKNLALSLTESFIASSDWKKINYDENTVRRALDIVEKFNCSIWDAIIVETMKENGIKKIFTEDKFFDKVPGIVAINPFRK